MLFIHPRRGFENEDTVTPTLPTRYLGQKKGLPIKDKNAANNR